MTNWSQVDPSFPDEEISLFGPGTDSGTFDYFTDVINGEEGASPHRLRGRPRTTTSSFRVSLALRARWATSATPTTRRTPTASRPSQVDSGGGCVAPSRRAAQDGTYAPLSWPLFIYVSNASYADKQQVATFVDFYIDNLRDITVPPSSSR